MKNKLSLPFLALSIFVFGACSSSGTSSTTSDSVSTNAGAIVAAAFSTSGQASISKALIQKAVSSIIKNQEIPGTCESVSEGGPSNVTSSLQGVTGTFGASSDSVSLNTDEDYCENSDGDTVTGTTLYATFTVSEAIVTCDDDSTATMSGTGVWTQDGDYCPEIYGTFTIESADGTGEADCTIRMSCSGGEEEGSAGIVEEATCSNDDGETITLSDDVSCEIDAG